MKLLLDEMYAPEIALQLRQRGHDVVAVKESPELIGKDDASVIAQACQEQRVLVTENIEDFAALDAVYRHTELQHLGIIFTTSKAFYRGHDGAIGPLVGALEELLTDHKHSETLPSLIYWLR